MEDLAQGLDETICWQCGAAADPECAYVEKLAARRLNHANLGYSVTYSRWHEYLTLTIPRCQTCVGKALPIGLCIIAATAAAIVTAGVLSDWNGGWIFLAFIFGSLLAGLAARLYEKLQGRRSLTSYPPLRWLLKWLVLSGIGLAPARRDTELPATFGRHQFAGLLRCSASVLSARCSRFASTTSR